MKKNEKTHKIPKKNPKKKKKMTKEKLRIHKKLIRKKGKKGCKNKEMKRNLLEDHSEIEQRIKFHYGCLN